MNQMVNYVIFNVWTLKEHLMVNNDVLLTNAQDTYSLF